ncbi:DUF2512 family protein [Gracilibacillus oryzae]|uniref:DUF2512 family protein n=1 Tax=Gracilibacillus oryzae TaxID=1672701 RepID=A0A7C8GUT6_9BACI|nr:DUF2512 family protein [Gracilibacillus oryzae]KAB8137841.1 DUF2512 family protein [Gracilibacillus oryzae]
MNYLKAFGVKLLITSIAVLSTFSIFYDASIFKVLLAIFIITGVSFVIGDMMLLPRVSNTMATIMDLPLNFALLWLTGELLLFAPTWEILSVAVFAAVLITVLEPFVHLLLERPEMGNVTTLSKDRFQTEISKELDEREEDK